MPSVTPVPLQPRKVKKNPGTFQDLGAPVASVLNIEFWDGFQLQGAVPILPSSIMREMQNGSYKGPQPNPKLMVTHTFLLGTSMMQSGRMYQFGANYMPSNRDVLVGKVNPSTGDLRLNVNKFLSDNVRMTMGGQIASDSSEQPTVLDGNVAYLGPGFSLVSKLGYNGSDGGKTAGFSFMQLFSDNMKIGCSTSYSLKTGLSSVSFGGSITGKQDITTVKFSSPQEKPGKMVVGYFRGIDSKVSLATELEVSTDRRSNLRLGWLFNMNVAKIQGSIDSNLVAMTTLEERLQPGFSLLFAAMADHANGKYKFGVGMNIGQ